MTLKIKICFVVETTFKMTDYLRDVEASMQTVVNQICFQNPGTDIRVGAVFYRDYKDAERISSTLNFLPPDDFFELPIDLVDDSKTWYWSENDTADVALGLKEVVVMPWEDADVKLIFHYGISPAHGRQFYGHGVSDMFPNGCPNGTDLLALMHEFSMQSVHYTFFRISPIVDTMLSAFHEVYTGPGKFDVFELDITGSYISEPDSEEE